MEVTSRLRGFLLMDLTWQDRDKMAINGERDQLRKVSMVLRFFAAASSKRTWWGVREVSKQIGLPVTTAHRTLGALAEIGYLRRDHSGHYAIGVDFLRLAMRVRNSDPLLQVSRPHLEQLARQSGESVLLARFDGATNALVFIELITSAIKRDYEVPLYKPLTIYKGASGIVILSHLSHEVESAVDADSLRLIRAKGVAFSRGQRIPGAVGIASPLISPDGCVMGSVTLTLPETRLPSKARCLQLEHFVKLCSQHIQRDLRVFDTASYQRADESA